MNTYGMIKGTLQGRKAIRASLNGTGTLKGNLTIPSTAGIVPYEGEYEFTPSDSAQAIQIEGMKAGANIIINPIPSNYGLITWDGTILTVS